MTSVETQHLDNGSGFEMVDAPVMGSSEVPQGSTIDAAPPAATAIPDLSEAADFGATDGAEAAATVAATGLPTTPEQEQPVEARSKGLYFVRIPRPNIDDGHVKALQQTFQGHVARVRQLNEKLQNKRGEMIELRKQMSLAKSLRDGSQPEFEEKLGRLQELRQMRGSRVSEMRDIKSGLKGLECRSEAELDEKIRDYEGQISDGSLTIREEKMVVQAISKLRGQRERVRQYESQNKSRLGELEGESSQVRAVISELEAEFNVLKGERDQATKIIQELYEKLKKAGEEYSVLEEEQKEVVEVKNEVLEKLNKARADMDFSMKDYRENRKFSLLIRDLVAAGQVDQARLLCEQQIEEGMEKINSDVTYRAEYFKLWSQQRKYLVSELLPNSAPSDVPRPDASRGQGPKTGQRGAPPKPQGKLKAEAIIAAALEEATRDLSASGYRPGVADSVSDVEDDLSDPEPVTVPIPAARKPTGGDSVFKHKVELPPAALLQSDGFVLPVAARAPVLVPTEELKAKVREENQKKAAEAAARKKRRQDAVDRKRSRAAESAKRKAEETAALKAAGAISAAEETVTDLSTAENTAEDTDTGADVAVAPAPKPVKPMKVVHRTIKASIEKPVAKLPKTVQKKKVSTVRKWLNDNQVAIVCAVVAVIMAVLLILWFSTGQ